MRFGACSRRRRRWGRRRVVFLRSLFRCRFGGVHEIWNAGFDSLVRGQLGLGVELELTSRPSERGDDGVIARLPIALGVKEVTGQEVGGGRVSVTMTQGKGDSRPLAAGRSR